MARRQLAPVALVLALTVAGFFGARALGERDARHDSEHEADLAAAQIRARVDQASGATEGLRLLMAGAGGMTSEAFATNASRWLGPEGFPAAAWVEQVPASGRAAYERRVGRPIVAQDSQGRSAAAGPQASYLPSTLVSGIAPMASPGTDLSRQSGMDGAVQRAGRLYDGAATPLTREPDGPAGLFLVRFAPRLSDGVVTPGFVVVFVSDLALRAAAGSAPVLRVTVGGTSTGAAADAVRDHRGFTAAGQRFDVAVPRLPVRGAAGALPWIVVACGLALAVLAAALGSYAARRARAQEELDRIFTLSPDLITVADFDGHFARVNPAVEQVLGYTPAEFVARPYLELVHPDDRDATAAEAAAIGAGKKTLTFTNRYIGKDGAPRVLEWTSTPVVEDGLTYGVGRDITARRAAESELRRLADTQAALRRVATLVARGTGAEALFRAVADEVSALLGCETAAVVRFETDGRATVVGGHRARRTPLTRFEPDPGYVVEAVRRTGRAARFDTDDPSAAGMPEPVRAEGIRSGLASPIIVAGELWGTITAASLHRSLPARIEERLADFTELVATAISNTQAREELRRLADEQAALGRVATLVAEGSAPTVAFDAVAIEMARLLQADNVMLSRYESEAEMVIMAHQGPSPSRLQPGLRLSYEGDSVTALVRRTERPGRVEIGEESRGATADVRDVGAHVSVGAPIVVAGRLWGVIVASWEGEEAPPNDTEERMARFAELLDTAIANADSRDQLAASRARLLTEADAARRRVVRDLHDGAQQRLVHTILTLKLARRALSAGSQDAASLVDEALTQAEQSHAELRELAHGILPPVLAFGGLPAGVDAVVDRIDLPVRVDLPSERFPAAVEASAYFIVAEALTNIVKHADAARAEVTARVDNGTLRVEVCDDGVGGADRSGHGLVGMHDRVTALGGRLEIDSPPGGGTRLAATLPLAPAE